MGELIAVETVTLQKYICDTCNKGEQRATGEVYQSIPPQYIHKCTQCNTVAVFLKTYPHLVGM